MRVLYVVTDDISCVTSGCMIVQLLDYRPPKGKDPLLEQPVCSHVVLNPNSESLWQDICLLNQKLGGAWTDQETLELEAKILVSYSTK
jgi:transcription factor SPT20